MSTSREVTVWCDGKLDDGNTCGQWVRSPSASAKEARSMARGMGWWCRLDGRKDLCPSCANARMIELGLPVNP